VQPSTTPSTGAARSVVTAARAASASAAPSRPSDAALEEVARRGWRRVGVLGFRTAPPVYTEPLRRRGIACETIDATRQGRLDAGIQTPVARTMDMVSATGGLRVAPEHSFTDVPRIDLLVVPGGFGTRSLMEDGETLD
jgi:putative intracellular protease/amidase